MLTRHACMGVCWALFIVVASGCSTTLRVSRLPGSSQSPPEGIVYYLPKVQFDITLTRELLKCEPIKRTLTIEEGVKRGQSAPTQPQQRVRGIVYGAVNLEVAITPEVTPRYIADPAEGYLIQYERLNAPLKQTDIQVDLYSNGTLKSVNIVIEDRAKEAVANVIKGTTSIAKVALAPGEALLFKRLDGNLVDKESTLPLCKHEISAALQTVKRLSMEIRKVEMEIAQVKEEIETKAEALAAAAGNAPSDLFGKVEELKTRLKNSEKKLAQLQKELGDTRRRLTHVQHYSVTPEFAPDRPRFTVDPLPPEDGLVLRWFDQSTIEELAGNPQLPAPRDPDFRAEYPLAGKLDPRGRYPVVLNAFANVVVGSTMPSQVNDVPKCVINRSPRDGEIKCGEGIVYKQPVEGDVMICQERSCLSGEGKLGVPPDFHLFSKSLLVPQAGVRSSLPLANGVFDKNTISAEFSESGALVKLKYTTEAEAEKATALLAETAEALTKIRLESIKAETQRIEEETKRFEALKKRAETEKALKKALEELQ